jgi:molybdopterin/thiamine biosynthesis adenylyltransferase
MTQALRPEQLERYARQLVLSMIGGVGQRQICAARVAIAAMTPAAQVTAMYLVAGGVAELAIADAGRVSGAGPLFCVDDVGRPILEAAAHRLGAMNPDVRITAASAGRSIDAAPGEASLAQGAAEARRILLELAR